MTHFKTISITVIAMLLAVVVTVIAFAWSGLYPVAAMPSHIDHSDTDNWDTVAFIRALPDMSAADYNRMTEGATHEHADGEGHKHGAESSGGNEPDGNGEASHEHDEGVANEHSEPADKDAEQPHDHSHEASTPEEAIDSFHHALVEGRAEDALAYLHPQATIAEGGQIESVSRYADGHMKADIRFLGQISSEPISREVLVDSDTQATIMTRRGMHGQTEQRSLDIVSIETATLVKEDAGWRIVQLGWSSTPYTDTP